jgi:hypothetical protein
MYDRPTAAELLDAVRAYLQDQIVPVVRADRRLYYQTLVAIHVLGTINREMRAHVEHLHEEWKRLNYVQDVKTPMPPDEESLRAALAERNKRLCEDIAAGRYDSSARRAALFEHLVSTTREQLEAANPRFLQALALEDQQRERLR